MATRSVSLSGTDKEKASQIVEASQRLVSIGMNRGSCGNISARCETTFKGSDSFLVTPSGIDPEKMTPESICLMNMSGETVEGGKPSSEWRDAPGHLRFSSGNSCHNAHSLTVRDYTGVLAA